MGFCPPRHCGAHQIEKYRIDDKEGTHQRTADPAYLRPVESQYAETHPSSHAEDLIDRHVIRSRPADE